MSPVVLDKIKNADDVRIVEERGSFSIQVKKNDVWETVLTKDDRQICENTVRKASSKTILG